MSQQRIVLTGASGTLGHHLLEQFAARSGVSVLGLLRKDSRTPDAHDRVTYERVDFFDTARVAALLRQFKPTSLIHCAASGMQFPRPEWFDLIRFNVDASLRLCECVSSIPGCRFVYVSTGLAYRDQGRPLSESDALDTLHPYGASKAAADILIRSAAAEFNVPLTVVRPFSFTGAGDDGTRLFPSLLRAAAANRAFDLSPGDQVRDHCAAQDIAAGILAAAAYSGASQSVFNLGSGLTMPLRALIEDVVAQLGLDVKLNFGARDYAAYEPGFMVANIEAARSALHWQPRRNLAFAVWQLARASFPSLKVSKPAEII